MLSSLPAFLESPDAFDQMYESRLGIYTTIADYTIDTEEQMWEVIHSDPFFASPPGGNPTA